MYRVSSNLRAVYTRMDASRRNSTLRCRGNPTPSNSNNKGDQKEDGNGGGDGGPRDATP